MNLTNVLIGLVVAIACNSPVAAEESQSTPASTPPSNVQATPYQKAIIDALLLAGIVSDIEKGKATPLSGPYPGLLVADAKKLSTAYDGNEFKADKTYKGKWIFMQGSIKEIQKSSEGPTAYLTPLGESYPSVRITFEDVPGIGDELGELDPGDYVSVICQGVGKEMLLPTLNKCVFYQNDSYPGIAAFKQKFIEAVEGKGDKVKNAPLAYAILSLQAALGANNEKICEKSPLDCMLAIGSLEKTEGELPVPQSYLDLGYTPEMLENK